MNLSTWTNTSSILPFGCVIERSSSCKVTVVGLASPIPNYLKIDSDIKLILALKSHKAWPTSIPLIKQGNVKLLGSHCTPALE